jgi:hypothetical protein
MRSLIHSVEIPAQPAGDFALKSEAFRPLSIGEMTLSGGQK